MRFGRTARLAAAVLAGGVLAAAAGCSSASGGSAGGESTGSAPAAKTLTASPDGASHPARPGPLTAATSRARASRPWPPRVRCRSAGRRTSTARSTASRSWSAPWYRGDRERLDLRARLLDRPGRLADARRDAGAAGRPAVRRHRPLGITGTPVYDAGNGLVYAVEETSGYHHVLLGLSVANGAVEVERDIPAPDGQPRYDQQRPALAIEDGRVYVAFGGLYGDPGRTGDPWWASRSAAADPCCPTWCRRRAKAPSGARRPGHRSVGHPVRQRGQRLGDQHQLRRQRLGDRLVPHPAAGRHLRAVQLVRRQQERRRPRLHAAGAAGQRDAARAGQERHRVPGQRGPPRRASAGRSRRPTSARPTARPRSRAAPCTSRASRAGWPRSAPQATRSACCRRAGERLGVPRVGGGAVWVTDWSAGTLYELDRATGPTRYSVSLGTSLPHFASLSMAGSHAYLGTSQGVVAVAGA